MTEKNSDTLGEVDHTHPFDGRPFGVAFRRGPTIAADGGRRDPTASNEEETDAEPTDAIEETAGEPADLSDISHTPPDGDGANRVWDGTQVRESKGDVTDDE
ncbi:MAG: hypothetical protein ABEH65_03910 [Halobacteriales archaeon]